MPRRRFYAHPTSFTLDRSRVTLAREESAHLVNVLRLRAGAEVYVFDGAGREYVCTVAASDGRRGTAREVVLDVQGEVGPARPESRLDLTLAAALLKGEKFDTVVQKATELGAARVVPVLTERGEVRWPGRGDETESAAALKRVARWERIAVEAAKQSGRARVPSVRAPIHLTTLLSEVAHDLDGVEERRVFFTERGGRGLVETVNEWPAVPSRVTAVVGPEGGWEDGEIEQAVQAGWCAVTLGGRVLRADTAAVVAAAMLQHLCGDLR
ncbi:MAG TPA: 16S rRNA (uracil(1498)-N(3))-methyltransferase [Pyrinomonadaceae bacterium]|nr:16S rRNA (uracil(1498)-N(3))-methyltransferase [Pyrinomonadaceae bacterium]